MAPGTRRKGTRTLLECASAQGQGYLGKLDFACPKLRAYSTARDDNIIILVSVQHYYALRACSECPYIFIFTKAANDTLYVKNKRNK